MLTIFTHPCPDTWQLDDSTTLTIRHITPADAQLEQRFVQGLSPQTRYYRFNTPAPHLSGPQLNALTHVDPDRGTALIAVRNSAGLEEVVGAARYMVDADNASGLFAIVVGDPWCSRGIGKRLLDSLCAHACARGVRRIYDSIAKSNMPMRRFAEHMGFTESDDPDDASSIVIAKALTPNA